MGLRSAKGADGAGVQRVHSVAGRVGPGFGVLMFWVWVEEISQMALTVWALKELIASCCR